MAPAKLTDEEHLLKEQYKALHDAKNDLNKLIAKKKLKLPSKKEALTPAKPSKSISKGNKTPVHNNDLSFVGSSNSSIKAISSKEAAANTENAKKLIASGLLKLKVEKKTSFKRSSNLKRRLNSEDSAKKIRLDSMEEGVEIGDKKKPSTAGADMSSSPPFNKPHHTTTDDSGGESAEKQATYSATPKKDFQRKKFVSKTPNPPQKVAPKTGNTVYVFSWQLTEEKLRDNFKSFGNIVDIKMKSANGNSGFISFDSYEAAEKSISEMNDTMMGDWRIKVSLARNQPLRHLAEQRWKELSHDRDEKGSNDRDSRNLVIYDDSDCFSP